MTTENQNIEWKESWRDEYLKWICGFANAQGGKIHIGKDDNGKVKGLSDARKLLEDIPNKVRDILGIMVDVNLHTEAAGDYLEIIVEPYPYPISYKGQYHYRSGSTKQELKGAALDRFLLQKQGRRWDGVPVPGVSVRDLSTSAFEYFRRNAARTNRLETEVLEETNDVLIDKLHLMDGIHLKRAAILLFHPDPEKFATGAFVKIGYFQTDDDLVFHDTIHGPLFDQVEKAMDLLLTKYLRATISYQGLSRIETYPYPETALREALLNAIAHKDYSRGNPVQISVYENKVLFWNDGQLPDEWTVAKLTVKHPSIPFNPDIATAFFRAGLIEAWGRGTIKMIKECEAAQLPAPKFHFESAGLMVEFHSTEMKKLQAIMQKLSDKSLLMLKMMYQQEPLKRKDILSMAGLSNQTFSVKRYFEPLLTNGTISPTITERPKSQLQRYFLTAVGNRIAQFLVGEHDGLEGGTN
jgi:ATP-dependent DNA helicase RecG